MSLRPSLEKCDIMKKIQKFITTKKHWQILAKQWEMYTEPGRPGKEDIKNYDRLIKITLGNKKKAKVVVLGATPEIRDLLYKYYLLNNIQVVCVDMMPEMYQAMNELVTIKITNEKFIHSDWLKMKFPKNSIDLFIGDLVIGNLPNKEIRGQFLENIRCALKKDGCFIPRHWWATPKTKLENVKLHLFNYTERVIKEDLTIKQAASYLRCDLLAGSWHRNKENITSTVFYAPDIKKLSKYFTKKYLSDRDKIAKAIFQYALKIFTGKRWCYFDKVGEIKQLNEFFAIKKILFSHYSIFTENSPILLLKPKK